MQRTVYPIGSLRKFINASITARSARGYSFVLRILTMLQPGIFRVIHTVSRFCLWVSKQFPISLAIISTSFERRRAAAACRGAESGARRQHGGQAPRRGPCSVTFERRRLVTNLIFWRRPFAFPKVGKNLLAAAVVGCSRSQEPAGRPLMGRRSQERIPERRVKVSENYRLAWSSSAEESRSFR